MRKYFMRWWDGRTWCDSPEFDTEEEAIVWSIAEGLTDDDFPTLCSRVVL